MDYQESERIFVSALLKSMIEAGQLALDASPHDAYERLLELAKVSRGLYREMWPEPPPQPTAARPPQRAAQSARGPAAARHPSGSEFPEAFWDERVKVLKKTYPPDGPTWKQLLDSPRGRRDLEWLASLEDSEGKWAALDRKRRLRAAACLDYLDQMHEGPGGSNVDEERPWAEETPF